MLDPSPTFLLKEFIDKLVLFLVQICLPLWLGNACWRVKSVKACHKTAINQESWNGPRKYQQLPANFESYISIWMSSCQQSC